MVVHLSNQRSMKTQHYWDTLQLTFSTDETGAAYVRYMYDKDELKAGYNIMRERRFNHDAFDFPEVIIIKNEALTLELNIYYEGEEEYGQSFTLHLDEAPEVEVTVGTEERHAQLNLRLVAFDEPLESDERDDDGRFDAWA